MPILKDIYIKFVTLYGINKLYGVIVKKINEMMNEIDGLLFDNDRLDTGN